MAVQIRYAGEWFTLHAAYDGNHVTNQIVNRLNSVRRFRDDLAARSSPLVEGVSDDYQPWVFFRLETGSEINILVHDGMEILVKDPQGVTAPRGDEDIPGEPYLK